MRGIRHGYGERNQLRPRLDVSHRHSNVTPPDVDNRRAAAIVAGVHALIIFLLKIGVQRHDPVETFLVGATLVRPESWRAHTALRLYLVRVVGPTLDREFGCSGIGVLDLEKRHRGKVVVYGDGDLLCERSRLSFDGEPLTFPENVFCTTVFMRGQEKSGPELVGSGHSLRGTERPHDRLRLVETGNHPAPQAFIKFNAQIATLNLRLAGRDVGSCSKQTKCKRN